MTLIEVLCEYRYLVYLNGRDKADEWLKRVCQEHLWEDIQTSIDDRGNFIDAEGYCVDIDISD
jgi:hypothetical protein